MITAWQLQRCSALLKKVFKNISLPTFKTEEMPAKPRTLSLKIKSLCSILQTVSNQEYTICQTVPVRSGCSGPIQLSFEHLQGRKVYSFSRQPVSLLKHPYDDLITLVLTLCMSEKPLASSHLYPAFRYRKPETEFPLRLPFLWLNKPSSLLHVTCKTS